MTSHGFYGLFFQICFNNSLGGGFKYFLFSARTLGKIQILTNIFRMGWNHQLDQILLPSEIGMSYLSIVEDFVMKEATDPHSVKTTLVDTWGWAST